MERKNTEIAEVAPLVHTIPSTKRLNRIVNETIPVLGAEAGGLFTALHTNTLAGITIMIAGLVTNRIFAKK